MFDTFVSSHRDLLSRRLRPTKAKIESSLKTATLQGVENVRRRKGAAELEAEMKGLKEKMGLRLDRIGERLNERNVIDTKGQSRSSRPVWCVTDLTLL